VALLAAIRAFFPRRSFLIFLRPAHAIVPGPANVQLVTSCLRAEPSTSSQPKNPHPGPRQWRVVEAGMSGAWLAAFMRSPGRAGSYREIYMRIDSKSRRAVRETGPGWTGGTACRDVSTPARKTTWAGGGLF
jgi:hypothetical protein